MRTEKYSGEELALVRIFATPLLTVAPKAVFILLPHVAYENFACSLINQDRKFGLIPSARLFVCLFDCA